MKNLAIPLPTSTDSFKIRFSHLILQHVPQSHRSITVSTFFSLPCFHSIATSPYKYPSMKLWCKKAVQTVDLFYSYRTLRGIMLCLRALSASRDLLCFVFPGSKEISRKLFFGTGEGAKGGVKIKSIRFQNSGSGYKI
ncbi:uncharacterized protein LOC123908718 isoform X4 [Trifolium pratense]|uniref:Uncharacterized protein n=1 Tax=Trifolium pratense TaxID=57577 RepID=A0ACB0IB43_TRIPR|nr:uncharacterized protein LOC123908718 isoform X4 [Trifolium pratense]CAJ2629481.1 unnamed protein product [Trifolium pratense]